MTKPPPGGFSTSATQMQDDTLDGTEAAQSEQPGNDEQSEATEVEQTDEAETETDDSEKSEDGSDDETEAKDGDGEDDEGKDEKAKPKREPRHARYQRQIDRLKAQLAEASSRTSGSPSAADVASEVEKIIGKPPQEADFKGDYLAFERAQTAYEIDKRIETRRVQGEAQRHQARAAERRAELAEAHQERVEEFRERAKDFDDVMKAAKSADLKASPVVEDLILDSDKSAHVVYYLAKNPGRLDELNRMTERQAAREIGRIEARLSLPQPKKQTQAPPPVKPPRGGAAAPSPEAALNAWLKKTYRGAQI